MIPCLYDCFKHWSTTGSVYLFSDTHFGDDDLKAGIPSRPSDEEILHKIKEKCHKSDTLILLGDVGDPELLNELKCRKVLVKGNHDAGTANYKPYFDEIYEGPVFIAPKILLSHEPIELPFGCNICGHVHERYTDLAANIHCINPDRWNCYEPRSLGEMIKQGIMSFKPSIHRYVINKNPKNSK